MNEPDPSSGNADWHLRPARESDAPALESLIALSARELLAPYYSAAQIAAAMGPIFGVDRQLIRDGTYFVAESVGMLVGCGGWSRRRSLYGGDKGRTQEDDVLDPKRDAARVRAFFVHPAWARRGIGRAIMKACERAIEEAQFRNVDIVATLGGEPLYAAFGYAVVERYEIPMPGGLSMPAVRMAKSFEPIPAVVAGVALGLVVLRSADVARATKFYGCLGLQFNRHQHGSGEEHYAAELGGAVFELYPLVSGGPSTLGTRVGFTVPSIDASISALVDFPSSVISPPKESQWGRRAVLADPDGHRVELIERQDNPHP